MASKSFFPAFVSVLLACALASPAAADKANPDWPCVWRKVVELNAATIWDGPEVNAESGDWRSDDTIRKLSEFLVSRRIKIEDAEAAIKKYAEGLDAASRDKKLTDLFTAVLSRTNDERKTVISGIERFHKRQLGRAKEIEQAGGAVPPAGAPQVAEAQSSSADPLKLTDAEEKRQWEVRVFQERQQSIPIACEIPQLMDERAGAIARAIRAEMKS